jgi:hypothetical protein
MDIQKQIEYFDSVATPSKEYTKTIKAGRLKGMTDIKPQWRILALTQRYGLCGFGWKYEIVNKTIVDGADGTQVGFVDINLFVKIDDEWSAEIPGTGGSSFIANERNGKYTSDEVYKMALTDAISVAAKAIGVASDIYLGIEPSKYEPKEIKQTETKKDNRISLTIGSDNYNKCVTALKGGFTFVDIEKKYILSEEVRTALKDAAAEE